jgi:hypothetical protein
MEGADSQTTLNCPSAIAIDNTANEVFVADMGNRRVVVFDDAHVQMPLVRLRRKTAGAAPGRYSRMNNRQNHSAI